MKLHLSKEAVLKHLFYKNELFARKMPEIYHMDREFIKKLISKEPLLLKEWQGLYGHDREIVELALSIKHDEIFPFISDNLKKNRGFVLQTLKTCSGHINEKVLQNFLIHFKQDEEIILVVLQSNPFYFKKLSKIFKENKDFIKKLFNHLTPPLHAVIGKLLPVRVLEDMDFMEALLIDWDFSFLSALPDKYKTSTRFLLSFINFLHVHDKNHASLLLSSFLAGVDKKMIHLEAWLKITEIYKGTFGFNSNIKNWIPEKFRDHAELVCLYQGEVKPALKPAHLSDMNEEIISNHDIEMLIQKEYEKLPKLLPEVDWKFLQALMQDYVKNNRRSIFSTVFKGMSFTNDIKTRQDIYMYIDIYRNNPYDLEEYVSYRLLNENIYIMQVAESNMIGYMHGFFILTDNEGQTSVLSRHLHEIPFFGAILEKTKKPPQNYLAFCEELEIKTPEFRKIRYLKTQIQKDYLSMFEDTMRIRQKEINKLVKQYWQENTDYLCHDSLASIDINRYDNFEKEVLKNSEIMCIQNKIFLLHDDLFILQLTEKGLSQYALGLQNIPLLNNKEQIDLSEYRKFCEIQGITLQSDNTYNFSSIGTNAVWEYLTKEQQFRANGYVWTRQ